MLLDLLTEEFIRRYGSCGFDLGGTFTGPLLIGGGRGGLSANDPFLEPAGESRTGGSDRGTCGEFRGEFRTELLASDTFLAGKVGVAVLK